MEVGEGGVGTEELIAGSSFLPSFPQLETSFPSFLTPLLTDRTSAVQGNDRLRHGMETFEILEMCASSCVSDMSISVFFFKIESIRSCVMFCLRRPSMDRFSEETIHGWQRLP